SPPQIPSDKLDDSSRVLKAVPEAHTSIRYSSDDDESSDNERHRRTPPAELSPPRASAGREKPEARQQQSTLPTRLGAAGGRYMPPALKRKMMADAASRGDAKEVQQRESWDQLKKRINASVNRANIGNIKDIIVELFGANLVRGRGLLCRLLMRAQSQSTSFTAVYAALVAVINTKLPLIGELMVTRLVLQFR
ncbi:pre-mRNA-splicing factor cwc22, partial [Coemansia sp. RSA 2522]